MYTVSDVYKKDMAELLRGVSSVKVAHSIPNVNNDNITLPTGLFDNAINYFFADQIQTATFEPSGCLLDGTYFLKSDISTDLGEFVSNVSSTDSLTVSVDYIIILDGTITALNIPKDIYLKFDSKQIYKVTGLTINMLTTADVVLATDTYTTSDFDGYSAQLTLPTVAGGAESTLKKIKLTITSINLPYSYVRLEKVILGTVNEFTNDELTSVEWEVSSDPLSFRIPVADMKFSFLDASKTYVESNPNSKFDNIIENQLVGFQFGYTSEGSAPEWLNGGVYRTTGEKSITSSLLPEVKINTRHTSTMASDLVRELEPTLVSIDNESEVLISLDNETNSLNTLLELIGVTTTIDAVETVPGTFDNIIDTATVVDSNLTVKEYTQLMANANGMMWTVDRLNAVDEAITLREFPKLQMGTKDNYDSALLNIYNQPVGGFTNLFDGIYLFQFNNDNLLELPKITNVPTSDGIDYAEYDHTTNETSRAIYPTVVSGVRFVKIDNPFVTTNFARAFTEPNLNFGSYIWDYYNEHKTYTLINRGFPELDVGDIIHLYVKYYAEDGVSIAYTLDKRCIVVSNKISYNGTIHGETKVLEWDIVLE